jgi:ribosomal protein S27AE
MAPSRTQTDRPLARYPHPGSAPAEDFDRIRCSDCGRTYPAPDGPALLYSLKASCPHCGGGFQLVL